MYTFEERKCIYMETKEIIEQIEKNLEEMRVCNEKLKEVKKVMDVIEGSEKLNGKK